MERNQEGNEKALQGKRHYYIRYDEKLIRKISRECGSETVKRSAQVSLRRLKWQTGEKFFCIICDDCAFLAGAFGKKHFRLAEIAVLSGRQKQGYGTGLLNVLKRICMVRGIERITLRTAEKEEAKTFWQNIGAQVIGKTDGDLEMEIVL